MGDELSVQTVLIESRDAGLVRGMALVEMADLAERVHKLAKCARAYSWCHGRVTIADEKALRQNVEELKACLELIGQVGWRKPKERAQ